MPKIGNIILSNSIISAPLAGISDYSFRQLMRDFGVGLTYSEMISTDGVYRNNKKSKTFSFVKNEHPVNTQIFGHNPEYMAYAASFFEDQGADMIDINFGCPVPKVVKHGSGAALARDLQKASQVICAVRKVLSIPLTIKIRLGWCKNEENYLELASIAEKEGVNAICLHARYATQLYTGVSDWSKVKLLKNSLTIPVIGSGDLKTTSDLAKSITEYGADLVMVGRGLMGNPQLISSFLKTPSPPLKEIIVAHFNYLLAYHGEPKACKLIRKFFPKYIKSSPNAKELKMKCNLVDNSAAFFALLEDIIV